LSYLCAALSFWLEAAFFYPLIYPVQNKMQKYPFFIILFLFLAKIAYSQQKISSNGGVFTPKGDIKALVVFVLFKDNPTTNPNFKNSDHYYQGWEVSENKRLPDGVNPETGRMDEILYHDLSQFEREMNSSVYNFSKDLYQISLGKFKFWGEVFKDSTGTARAIEVEADGCVSFGHSNKAAWAEMKRLNPKMDLSGFDQRTNFPNYAFDNSDTSAHKADKKLDYVIFIYRYRRAWGQQPMVGMNLWAGADGGFAGTNLGLEDKFNSFACSEGFTMCYNSGVFIHELAHTLYNCPHLFGANKVVGEYLHRPALGWGATSQLSIFKGGLTAWERWYLGYIEPKLDLDKNTAQDKTYEVEIGDFVTTGDAVRINLPFSGKQNLWIEYHSGETVFDQHPWQGQVINNDTIRATPAGIYAYIEETCNSRNEIIHPLSNRANSLKLLNAAGNYDYELLNFQPVKNAWGNDLYEWERGQPNPISGTNAFFHQAVDLNQDGKIDFNKNYNQGSGEYIFLAKEKIRDSFVNLYGCFGFYDGEKNRDYARIPTFQPNDSLTLNSNPMPLNHPKYQLQTQTTDAYILNGLSVYFKSGSQPNSRKIIVKYKQTVLNKNANWSGHILLPNISQDSSADLIVGKNKKLYLLRNRTADRHTITEDGFFSNPTKLVIAQDAVLLVKKGAVLIIDEKSSLQIKGKLILEKGAKLQIEKGSRLVLDNPEGLIINKKAKLIDKNLAKVGK